MSTWHQVPNIVRSLIKEGSTMFTRLREAARSLPHIPKRQIYFNPKTQHVYLAVHKDHSEDLLEDWRDGLKVKGVKAVIIGEPTTPPRKEHGPWLHVKAASLNDVLSFGAQAGGWKEGFPSNVFGGPNPLSATIASGALGAGIGYGTGTLLENLFPKKYLDKGKLRRTLGLLGGGIGALPGMWTATVNWRNNRGMLDPIGAAPLGMEDEPKEAQTGLKQLNDIIDTLLCPSITTKQEMNKLADAGAFGDTDEHVYVQTLDVDPFNKAIWRDPFLSIPMKGVTSGIIEGASQVAGGSSAVSPMNVARLAVGMGTGLASGLLVGKTLGALAGITPEAQESLQRAGIFAGIVKSVVPMLFNSNQSSTIGSLYAT